MDWFEWHPFKAAGMLRPIMTLVRMLNFYLNYARNCEFAGRQNDAGAEEKIREWQRRRKSTSN